MMPMSAKACLEWSGLFVFALLVGCSPPPAALLPTSAGLQFALEHSVSCSESESGQHLRNCGLHAWSRHRRVSGIPLGRTFQSPSITFSHDTLYAVGNLLPRDIAEPVGSRPATIIRLPGKPLEMPPGDFLFAHPKLIADSRGVLHLFWSESDIPQPDGVPWPPVSVNALWYAEHTSTGWSTPQQIVTAQWLGWGVEDGAVAVDSEDRIHLVLPVLPNRGLFKLAYLRRAGATWERNELDISATYATIVPLRRDSLMIAYSGRRSSEESQDLGVFILNSGDGGLSWSGPTLLTSIESDRGLSPAVVHLKSGELHVLWKSVQPTGAGSSTVLEQWQSDPSHQQWRRLPSVSLPGRVFLLRFASDQCDVPITVAEVFDGGERMLIMEVNWIGGVPHVHTLFPEVSVAASPSLQTNGQRLLMLWSAVEKDGSEPVVVVSDRVSDGCGKEVSK